MLFLVGRDAKVVIFHHTMDSSNPLDTWPDIAGDLCGKGDFFPGCVRDTSDRVVKNAGWIECVGTPRGIKVWRRIAGPGR